MAQSLSRILIHTIFSTKDREPSLQNPDIRYEMHSMLGGIADKLKCKTIRIGGVSDHVHLFTNLGRTVAVSDFVKEVKRQSTNWIQERGGIYTNFHWQSGYGTFSVAQSQAKRVIQYIDGQEEHHKKKSFQDEFREFMEKYEVEYDERYVWD